MTFSGHVTRTVTTPNQSSRNGRVVDFIVYHHMASTSFQGVLNSWISGRKQGSCHYAISNEGEIVGVVPEENRAWSLSSVSFDSRAIVYEIENASYGDAFGWPISEAAAEAAARLTAEITARRGMILNRTQAIGHREVFTRHGAGYPTACPGALDLDGNVGRALTIRGPGSAVAYLPITPVSFGSPVVTVDYGNAAGKAGLIGVQEWLAADWGYTGLIDGVLGDLSWTALQKFLAAHYDYDGVQNGAPGLLSWMAAQRWLTDSWEYTGWIDGLPGEGTYAALGRAGGSGPARSAPSAAPQASWHWELPTSTVQRDIQQFLKDRGRYSGRVDGIFGGLTIAAIQLTLRNVGYTGLLDGIPGEMTCYFLQVYAARFGSYIGPIDKALGTMSWNGFRLGLKRP